MKIEAYRQQSLKVALYRKKKEMFIINTFSIDDYTKK